MPHKRSGWIWLSEQASTTGPIFACFRRELTLNAKPGAFPVRVSADARYKLYCNGEFCCAGPCKSDNSVRYYDEIDLSPFLREGENILYAIVLHYPAGQRNHSIFCTPTPGLWMQSLACDPASGKPLLQTDARWQSAQDTERRIVSENRFFAPLQIYEHAAPDPDFAAWHSTARVPWQAASEYDTDELSPVLLPENLLPRPIPFLTRRRVDFLAGALPPYVAPYTAVTAVLDAGCLKTAYLVLHMVGGAGARIELLQAESYVRSAPEVSAYESMPVKGDRTDPTGLLTGYTDRYTVCGRGTAEEPECYEPFWFRTFRYIKVTITTGAQALTALTLDSYEANYPLDVQTSVETSEPLFAELWNISVRSLRCCMHETYEDCPYYEQMQYAMDARSQMLYTYNISADDRLARKCMEEFRRALRPCGLLNASYPNNHDNVIPGFSIYYIGMLYDHMMYFGDAALLCRHLPMIHTILQYFAQNLTAQGLVDKIGDVDAPAPNWSFVDWTPEWAATRGVPPATLQGPLTMESLLYLRGLQYAEAICRYLGQTQAAARYAGQADALRAAINTHCRNADGMYRDGPRCADVSQHCQVFAVLTDTCTPAEGRRNLLRTLDEPACFAQCSVAMALYLFRALEKCGLYAHTKKLWDPWRVMLKNHLTTCAEDSQRQRSDCHAWGALALYELPASILGVRPAAPGYAKAIVAPHTEFLSWAHGTVITPRGKITVTWQKGDDGTARCEARADTALEIIENFE